MVSARLFAGTIVVVPTVLLLVVVHMSRHELTAELHQVGLHQVEKQAAPPTEAAPPTAMQPAVVVDAPPDPCAWRLLRDVDGFNGVCDLSAAAAASASDCADRCDTQLHTAGCGAFTFAASTCYLKRCFSNNTTAASLKANVTTGRRVDPRACEAQRNALKRWAAEYRDATFEKHLRKWDDGDTYGPIVTVRGERHCGTNWVRAIITKNCRRLPHKLGPRLDSDGAYGWKHGFLPPNFDARSRDIVVVVFRCAATWLPKMKEVSYNEELDKRRKMTLAKFVDLGFRDNFSERRFDSILTMRTEKYRQYAQYARDYDNVAATRYEDLVLSSSYLLTSLAPKVASCDGKFVEVKGHAKFGKTAAVHVEDHFNWSLADWTAMIRRLDTELEAELGYRYDPQPGQWHLDPPPSFILQEARSSTDLVDTAQS